MGSPRDGGVPPPGSRCLLSPCGPHSCCVLPVFLHLSVAQHSLCPRQSAAAHTRGPSSERAGSCAPAAFVSPVCSAHPLEGDARSAGVVRAVPLSGPLGSCTLQVRAWQLLPPLGLPHCARLAAPLFSCSGGAPSPRLCSICLPLTSCHLYCSLRVLPFSQFGEPRLTCPSQN